MAELITNGCLLLVKSLEKQAVLTLFWEALSGSAGENNVSDFAYS